MFRRALFLFAVAFLANHLYCQEPQSKPPDAKPADQQSAPPNVFIIKPPPPPPDQAPAMAPQLKATQLDGRPKLNEGTKMQLIQILDAELVHTRKYLPLGDKSTTISPEGEVKPGDQMLYQMAQTHGAAAKIGDRVQITNITFHEKTVYVEINGGPKKKTKWYDHITINGAGGSTQQQDLNSGAATGSSVTLQFAKYVPEMNAEELRKMLSPVLDFSVKSASEVYIDTMPPKIKAALKAHEVLVGMNKDMVVMAKDRPPQKVREKDDQGQPYEEWIYGRPPQDVVFVRFRGDEVIQVKTAKISGEMIVKNQREVQVQDGVASMAALQASQHPQDVKPDDPAHPQPQGPTKRPTLRKEGEAPDPSVQRAPVNAGSGQPQPGSSGSDHSDEPQWGTKPKDRQQPDQQKPDQPPLQL
jgi:hypothetical protein